MKKIIAILLLVITITTFLSGCRDSDSDSITIEDAAEWFDSITEDDDTIEKAFDTLDDRGLGF